MRLRRYITDRERKNNFTNKWISSLAISAIIILLLVVACAPANRSPIITSLQSEHQIVPPSGISKIECAASVRDGDSVSYKWSTSGGSLSGEGSVVTWQAPDIVGKYAISVEAFDSNGNQDAGRLVITVRINHPPTITRLLTDADKNLVIPSGSCRVKCYAEDPDGDKVAYSWAASGGNIFGTGPVVTWFAPETTGIHNITVAVTDGLGGEGRSSLNITAALSCLPIIENLIVTPKEPRFMKGEKIFIGKSCELKCIASDPDDDELSYAWSADGGKLDGEGPVLTWTAPHKGGKVTITVTISDGTGGTATESKVFRVVTCTCALR